MKDTKQPVQICTLWGCENVKEYYYLVDYDVVNIKTGHVKSIGRLNTKRGYPYVTLETNDGSSNKKCMMHHLIALGYISNEPYKVIEHLDDDPWNYDVENLKFSNQSANISRAFENGRPNRVERTFRVVLRNGKNFIGTMKELAEKIETSRQTIYDRFYTKRPGKTIFSVTEIKSTDYRKDTDRLRVPGLSPVNQE